MQVGRRWQHVPKETAAAIRGYLLREGGIEDPQLRGAAEVWRIRFSEATFTYYASGTLYSTPSQDPAVVNAWEYVTSLTGPRFEPACKNFMVGLDETGKGEIIGHTVLAGVLIPQELTSDLENIVSTADTKRRRTFQYWDELFRQIDSLKPRGLEFTVERIPPWHVDRYNLNKIMDVVYQRILSNFSRRADLSQSRVVVDDYGIGHTLDRYLRALQNRGCEVVIATRADDLYLEAKAASVIAKRERERVMEGLRAAGEFQVGRCTVGSGNATDTETINWLKAWKEMGREWPWFVKRSFKTVREFEGLTSAVTKQSPPIRDDILSPEFLREFETGRLSISSLSVVCPTCGEVSRAALITPDGKDGFNARCVKCRKPLDDLGITLRYYCGYLLPDSNVITGGLLGKDLSHSRLFEGFTILIHATVRRECDTPGGKKELERLAYFGAIGRIGLEEVGTVVESNSTIDRDQAIFSSALEYNAILFTDDNNMKAAAQARKMFTLSTRWS
ncbi:MAG TPA: hypothetical protein GX510_05495 [Firmicutes bacterium]|nr:hypothetical protein [Candidatus Fermentithermobacillaceae bacterium]